MTSVCFLHSLISRLPYSSSMLMTATRGGSVPDPWNRMAFDAKYSSMVP